MTDPRPRPRFLALLLPTVVAGCFAVWLTLVGASYDRHTVSFALIVACAALATVLQRLLPTRAEWAPSLREAAVDGLYILGALWLFEPIADALTARPVVDYLHTVVTWTLFPAAWPLAVKVPVTLLLAELFSWAFHRMQHANGFLWRFHATHHAPTRMGWMKGPVNHPLEHLFVAGVRAIPLALLGADREAAGGAAFLGGVINLFAHTNIDVPSGVFGWVFTTPGQHLRHHSLDLAESRSNYACAVILWDRLLGTFGGDAPAAVRLGIEDGRALPLWEQLWLPFRRLRPLPAA